jgi:hypothetical protein
LTATVAFIGPSVRLLAALAVTGRSAGFLSAPPTVGEEEEIPAAMPLAALGEQEITERGRHRIEPHF